MTNARSKKRLRPHRKLMQQLQRLNSRHLRVTLGLSLAAGSMALQPSLNTLQQVRNSGELHLVGVSSPTTFYQRDGNVHGLQFELAQQFANELGVKLVIDPVNDDQQVLHSVRRNHAQLALTVHAAHDQRLNRLRVSAPLVELEQQLIQRTDRFQPTSLDDLRQSTIAVIAGSSEAKRLRSALANVEGVRLVEFKEGDSLDLLTLLDQGKIDYVGMIDQEFDAYRPLFPNLRDGLSFAKSDAVAWVFLKSADESLYQAAQNFLTRKQSDGTLERLAAFYGAGDAFNRYGAKSFQKDISVRLPRYQREFEKQSAQHGLDWRLLAAISYQESHWDQNAISPTGVQGLMMLTQDTAKLMGVKNRTLPKDSIQGGTAYFKQILSKLPASVQEPDRTWMALAAYNMGPGHMIAARKLTRKLQGDPNSWLDVSRNLMTLAQHNRANGKPAPDVKQALHYVQQVRRYYDAIALNHDAERDQQRVAQLDYDITLPGRLTQ